MTNCLTSTGYGAVGNGQFGYGAIPPATGIFALYGAANHAMDSTSAQGGAIDTKKRLFTGGLTIESTIKLASSSALDVDQVYSIEGIGSTRLAEGELIRLNGLTPVESIKSYFRINRIEKQSGATLEGKVIITQSDGPELGFLENIAISVVGNEDTTICGLLSNITGRPTVPITYYEKFFVRNIAFSTLTFTLTEESDPDECILFAFDVAADSSSTSLNRTTRPGLVPPELFTSKPKSFVLFAGQAIGIWIKAIVPRGMSAFQKLWTVRLSSANCEQLVSLVYPDGEMQFIPVTLGIRSEQPIGGGNPPRFLELAGAKFVTESFYEPDPITFRDQFYYNARINKLFKKINSKPNPVWKQTR